MVVFHGFLFKLYPLNNFQILTDALIILRRVIYQFLAQSCLSLWYSHKQSVEEGDNSGPEIIKLFSYATQLRTNFNCS